MFRLKKKYLFLFLMAAFNLGASPVVVYSHGIAHTHKQAFWYAESYMLDGQRHYNDRYLFSAPFTTFNYPDATESIMRVNVKEASMGQDNDIARLKHAINKSTDCIKKNCEVGLFGLSRGASVIVSLLGTHDLPQIKFAILESPFDSPTSIIQDIMKKFKLSWMPISWGETLLEKIFMKYSRNGITPTTCASNIRKDLPILIICSKEDQLVPYESTIALYNKLVESGHINVHLYVADYGKHSKILWGQNGETYQKVVHAFYEKYGFPHDATLAKEGIKYL